MLAAPNNGMILQVSGAKVYLRETIGLFIQQGAIVQQNSTAVLTDVQIAAKIIQSTSGGITLTFPTGTTLNNIFDLNDTALDIVLINSSGSSNTLAGNTNATYIGNTILAANASATFRIRRVGPTDYVIYRLT